MNDSTRITQKLNRERHGRGAGAGSAAIEAADLVKTYPGEVRALDGLSFTVEEGTVFGLLGPNGAGKSTTVKILTTLARPDAGRARVAGHDVLAEPAAVRREIGVVSQQGGLDPQATGRENLRLQGQVFGLGGSKLEARIETLLAEFGLADAGDRIVRTYSGGMRRRLDVALALVHEPRILFLDEPTTGLDPEIRAEMWRRIAALKDRGLTVLLTTHYLEEADRLASQLAIVDRGKIVAAGTPDELKRELRGDAIHVELEHEPDAGGDAVGANGGQPELRAALERVDGVLEVMVDGRALHTRAADGARAVPAVLSALEAHGVAVASVTVARPSLDDVYLRHTGRTFSAAEAESEQQRAAKEDQR